MKTRFRIERRSTKNGDNYYLTYPFSTPKRRSKISRMIKSGSPPTDAEFDAAVLQYGEEFSERAAEKYAEFRSAELSFMYIPRFLGKQLEKTRFLHKVYLDTLPESEREAYEELYDAKYIAGTAGLEDIPAGSGRLTRNFHEVRLCRETAVPKVTLEYVCEIHRQILRDLPEETGIFREDGDVEVRLQKTIDEYYARVEDGYCVFEQAVLFLYRFLVIHPFETGTGLVAREIFNFLLECAEYPRLIFPSDLAKLYTMGLDFGDSKDYQRMVTLFASISMRQRV